MRLIDDILTFNSKSSKIANFNVKLTEIFYEVCPKTN